MSLGKGVLIQIIDKAAPLWSLHYMLGVRTFIKSRKIGRTADIARNLHETLNQLSLLFLPGKHIQELA